MTNSNVLWVLCLLAALFLVTCEENSKEVIEPSVYGALAEIDTIVTVTVLPQSDYDYENILYRESYPFSPHQHLIDDTTAFKVFDIDIQDLVTITLSATSHFSKDDVKFFLTFYAEDIRGYTFLTIFPGNEVIYHGSWVGEAANRFGFFGYSENYVEADSIWLNLAINDSAYVQDSLFIMKPLHLDNTLSMPFPPVGDFPPDSKLVLRLWNDDGNEDISHYRAIVDATDLRPFYYMTVDSPYVSSGKFYRAYSGVQWWDYHDFEGYNHIAHALWLRLPSRLIAR